MKKKLLALVGPTCSGKTNYVETLKRQVGSEPINMDSFQLYSFFKLGTGRSDAKTGYLYGVINPHEKVNEKVYLKMVEPVVKSLLMQGSRPLFEGGSLTFLRALLARYPLQIIGIRPSKQVDVRTLIKNRVQAMGEENLINEVREGLRRGYRDTRAMQDGVIYLPIVRYLDGALTRAEALEEVQNNWVGMHLRQLSDYANLGVDIEWTES
jgi:tRNA A37 N6-isopentenylltransferase MiaA